MWVSASQPGTLVLDGTAVHLITKGDKFLCAKWLPYARNLFRETRKTALSNGLKSHLERVVPGVLIHIRHWPDGGRIEINATGCAKFDSGLFDVVLPPKPILDNMVDPIWDLTDPEGKPYQAVKQVYGHIFDAKNGHQYGPWKENKRIANNYINASNKTDSFLFKMPGRYTGRMRKVVQILIGEGKPVPFEYGPYLCHGIYMAADGKPWIIEISQVNGVLAAPMSTCKSFVKDAPTLTGIMKEMAESLGFYPVAPSVTVPFLTKDIDKAVTRLAPPSALEEVYSKAPCHAFSGWKFSPDGHEAQNVFLDTYKADTRYLQGFRYKLAFTESQNKLVQAILQVVESDVVYHTTDKPFKIPHADGNLVTAPFYTHVINPPFAFNGPVYVFYTDSGEEVVCRTKGDQVGSSSWSESKAAIYEASSGHFIYGSGTEGTYITPTVNGHDNVCQSRSGTQGWVDRSYQSMGYYSAFQGAVGHVTSLYDSSGLCATKEGAVVGGNYAEQRAIVIPVYDAQCVFVFDQQETTGSSYQLLDWSQASFYGGNPIATLRWQDIWPECQVKDYISSPTVVGIGGGGASIPMTWIIGAPTLVQFTKMSPPAIGRPMCAENWISGWGSGYGPGSVPSPYETGSNLDYITQQLAIVSSSHTATINSADRTPLMSNQWFNLWDGSNFHYLGFVDSAFADNLFCSKDLDKNKLPDLYTACQNYDLTDFSGYIQFAHFVGVP